MTARVLIAEDEANLGTILEQFLTARGFDVAIVRNGRAALDRLRTERFDVALLDIVMPELDGLEVLRLLREEPLPPEVIIFTGNGTVETALAAMKLGAYDFLSKPYRMAEVEALVRRAWEKRLLTRRNAALATRVAQLEPAAHFDTRSAPLRAVLSLVERIAQGDAPVLITGERGTGKSAMARQLHARSPRAAEPFVVVDCAGDPSAFLGSLLGHDAHGAVHAADVVGETEPAPSTPVPGAAELAATGTLYLDHVDALGRDLQRIVTEAMERGVVDRGTGRALPWTCRVVASSAADDHRLAQLVEPALLRLLTTSRITLPPLRDRVVDIPLLAERLLEGLASSRGGVHRTPLTADAIAQLERYEWPGNVRELRMVLERATLLARGGAIESRHLALDAGTGARAAAVAVPAPDDAPMLDLDSLERRQIAQALERTRWHQGKAAEMLGISPKTLYRKIREYGFRRPGGKRS